MLYVKEERKIVSIRRGTPNEEDTAVRAKYGLYDSLRDKNGTKSNIYLGVNSVDEGTFYSDIVNSEFAHALNIDKDSFNYELLLKDLTTLAGNERLTKSALKKYKKITMRYFVIYDENKKPINLIHTQVSVTKA